MRQLHSMVRPSPRRTGLHQRALVPLLGVMGLLAPAAGAQELELLVSTSADETHLLGAVGDDEFVLHGPASLPRTAWPASTLALHLGPASSGPLHKWPGDVDALHDLGSGPSGGAILFSFVADQTGWEDGDILKADATGVSEAWKEELLVNLFGATDGNLDVDALQLDPDGTLLLSFAEDEASTVLSGTTAGILQDGDVLSYDPVSGAVAVVMTESAVASIVATALGSSAAIGDVLGLARDPHDGQILFTVQSPTAHDGSVFSTANGGSILPGHDEASFGFQGAGELDALSVALGVWPGLVVSDPMPPPGSNVALTLDGLQPGEIAVLLCAMSRVPAWVATAGWGGLVLAEDALFEASLKAFPFLVATADGTGRATWSFDVPPSQPPQDVVAQAITLLAPRTASNPVLIEVAQ